MMEKIIVSKDNIEEVTKLIQNFLANRYYLIGKNENNISGDTSHGILINADCTLNVFNKTIIIHSFLCSNEQMKCIYMNNLKEITIGNKDEISIIGNSMILNLHELSEDKIDSRITLEYKDYRSVKAFLTDNLNIIKI